MRGMIVALAAFLAVGYSPTVGAQQKSAIGIEAGTFSAFDESIVQAGLRVAPPRGGYGAVEFTFATFPEALFNNVLAFMMDLGGAYGAPRDSSSVYVIPHGGVSLLTASELSNGGGGGGAAFGIHAGASLLVHLSPQLGFNVDYTYRRFFEGGAQLPCHSITAGLTFLR